MTKWTRKIFELSENSSHTASSSSYTTRSLLLCSNSANPGPDNNFTDSGPGTQLTLTQGATPLRVSPDHNSRGIGPDHNSPGIDPDHNSSGIGPDHNPLMVAQVIGLKNNLSTPHTKNISLARLRHLYNACFSHKTLSHHAILQMVIAGFGPLCRGHLTYWLGKKENWGQTL